MNDTFTNKLEDSIDWLCHQGAFFTVGNEEKANTMTISWGSVGFMWGKPVFIALVRKERYSYEFIKNGGSYTISIPFKDDMKKALTVCGTKSGRNTDKEREAEINFVKAKSVSTPIVYGCDKYYECNIILKQNIDLDNLDKDAKKKFYDGSNSNHIIYFGEILEAY